MRNRVVASKRAAAPSAPGGATRNFTNRSIGVTVTAQVAMAANDQRSGWRVKNDSDTEVWISFVGAATPAAGGGNMKIAASQALSSLADCIETSAMSIIHGGSGTKNVTLIEF